MKKVLLGTFAGFALFIAGLYVGYLSIEAIKNGATSFLLLGSFLLCGAGMFILYKAGRMDTFKTKFTQIVPKGDGKSSLEKNQEMVKDWKVASDKRDKLKLLEAAGAAEAEEKQQ